MRAYSFPILFSCLFITSVFGAETAAQRVNLSERSFQSAGRTIQVEHFESAEGGKHPRILVLHGAGGLIFDGPEMRRVARSLAEHGDSVDLVHYFNRTGTVFARDAAMQEHFEEWLDTVRTAITWAAADSRSPVGIYGYSLGAFLAVAAASDNPRVVAVVEHAGGVWNNKLARIGAMPPLLVVHGRADQRVPFGKYAEPLLARLRNRSPRVETRIFANEGHGFSPAAMVEVKQRAEQFFRAHRSREGSPAPRVAG